MPSTTAFSVVILDTLSALFDPAPIKPLNSSHPYTFNLFDNGVLQFAFPNIMLPDSNVNEPASHGFVKFVVSPVPGLSNGTVVENSAGIYFDFNEPVITNKPFILMVRNTSTLAVCTPARVLACRCFPTRRRKAQRLSWKMPAR